MLQTKMWRIFYVALGLGLIIGVVLYLLLHFGGNQIVLDFELGLPLAAGIGMLLGFSYYLFFKLVLRAFVLTFLEQAQALTARPITPLPPPWASNELDKLDELLTEALATLRRLDRFSSIAKQVVATLDSQKTLKRIISTAVESLPADGGVLFLPDGESQRYLVSASYPLFYEQLEQTRFRADQVVPGWTGTAQQRPCLISTVEDDPSLHPVFRQIGVQSQLSVPLVAGHQIIGLMSLFNRTRRNAFDENDLQLACTYADLAAVAIDNAQNHQRVQDERKKLTAVLNDTTDGVIVLDEIGQILLLNPAAERCLQVQAQQVTGQPIEATDVTDLVTAVEAAQASASPIWQEIVGPNGTILQASVSPVQNLGWVVVMQDITNLKELDQLYTEWVAAVSHDMKNPITVIQLAIGLLSKAGSLNQEQRRLTIRIEHHALQLRSLVINVLDLARLKAGPVLHKSAVDISDIVSSALAAVEPLALDKKQDLNKDISPELPSTYGDVKLLTRALVNLLSNAVKYTSAGGQITVRARCKNGTVSIQVADTGQGISAKALPHLFKRFYRVSDEEVEVEGTGLGLSIVKKIIDKHDGQIHVESTPGKGSVFTITLPSA